jgi:hypothetical protein
LCRITRSPDFTHGDRALRGSADGADAATAASPASVNAPSNAGRIGYGTSFSLRQVWRSPDCGFVLKR